MRCERARELLGELAEGGRSEVRAHVEGCEACGREVARLERAMAALRASGPTPTTDRARRAAMAAVDAAARQDADPAADAFRRAARVRRDAVADERRARARRALTHAVSALVGAAAAAALVLLLVEGSGRSAPPSARGGAALEIARQGTATRAPGASSGTSTPDAPGATRASGTTGTTGTTGANRTTGATGTPAATDRTAATGGTSGVGPDEGRGPAAEPGVEGAGWNVAAAPRALAPASGASSPGALSEASAGPRAPGGGVRASEAVRDPELPRARRAPLVAVDLDGLGEGLAALGRGLAEAARPTSTGRRPAAETGPSPTRPPLHSPPAAMPDDATTNDAMPYDATRGDATSRDAAPSADSGVAARSAREPREEPVPEGDAASPPRSSRAVRPSSEDLASREPAERSAETALAGRARAPDDSDGRAGMHPAAGGGAPEPGGLLLARAALRPRTATLVVHRRAGEIALETRGALCDVVPILLSRLDDDDREIAALAARRLDAIRAEAAGDPRIAERLRPLEAERGEGGRSARGLLARLLGGERDDPPRSGGGAPPAAAREAWTAWWSANRPLLAAAERRGER